ncbi:uncharacterized protein fam189a2.S isoform X1 [Xenopus laevis]|uniref:Uncharacterized protein fam189a2.S isoform X1 n=1 Tax=Xenopus laevis TaxID=8355 RepID=A0A8J1M4V6_XENLA|nr:uncharacterized protein fam189a2.S isoform X1 [Xenopus laevis]
MLTLEYLTRMCSDHAPLLLCLGGTNQVRRDKWRLPPKWIANPQVHERLFPQLTQYWEINQDTAADHIVWDAGKAFIRGAYISLIKLARSEGDLALSLAQDTLAKAESELTHNESDVTKQAMQSAQRDLDLLLVDKYSQRELYRAAVWYDKGDKNGKLLALLARGDEPKTMIQAITDGNALFTDPTLITQQFETYFQSTYQSPPDTSSDRLKEFLTTIDFPEISPDLATQLDQDITLDEIKDAINGFPVGKTPGPDGIPIEWYKKYVDFLAPKLLALFNGTIRTGVLPDSCYDAFITLIHKEGKPPDRCDSYRPISLLNCDVKIFAKIIANRLKLIAPDLIHPDQTGFMPSKATDINVRRLFTNLAIQHDNLGNRIVVSLDTVKAFDTVQWQYLWEVLTQYKLGPKLQKWIQLLYAHPRAKVLVNGQISDSIYLGRGTRQGCPLSPLLFALAIEPLAIRIRANEDIQGLCVGNLIEKISLYADDMLVYLANSGAALENLLATISEFGQYSGLKINRTKSVVFPIDPLPPDSPDTLLQLKVVNSFKYLGIVIHKDLNRYVQLNLDPVVQTLTNKVAVWQDLPLSLPGKINMFKMIFLPKFLYTLHNSPITPRAHWFTRLDKIIRNFLWAGEHPRLNFRVLQAPASGGGLALPNLKLYFLAAQLVYAHWWIVPDRSNSAVVLEAAVLGSFEALAKLPYRGVSPYHVTTTPMQTVGKAFQKSQELVRGTSTTWSPHTPLWGNNHLPHLRSLPDIARWAQIGIKTLGDIVTGGDCKSFATIQQDFHPHPDMLFRYFQLRHAFNVQFPIKPVDLKVSSLETYLHRLDLPKPLSWLYTILSTAGPSPLERVKGKWQADIPDLDDEKWKDALQLVTALSISMRDRLIQIKFLNRVYLTPYRLAKIYATVSDLCPKCSVEPGFMCFGPVH